MNTEKLLLKYKSTNRLKDFQGKLILHFQRQALIFGNPISASFKNVIYRIEDILQDTENFEACDFCNDVIFSGDLIEVESYSLCESCYSENYSQCESCQCDVYRESENYHVLYECEVYCNECYFKELENIYKKHEIKNKLLKDLQDKLVNVTYKKLESIQFKIDTHFWQIEKHSSFYRLGSWGANCWIDIGQSEANILKAIDYKLGHNESLLTSIDLE
jgi:hypothetical protein